VRKLASVLVSSLLGAVICALLSAAAFALGASLDGTQTTEALAYGAIVGVVGALVGAWIGFVIGLGNFGPVAGGIVGVLTTALLIGFYIVAVGRPGDYGYFLGESRIIFVVMALPTLLTGILTAWLRTRRKTGEKTSSNQAMDHG
jgi:MFS family permease